jgi:hypothetical protein
MKVWGFEKIPAADRSNFNAYITRGPSLGAFYSIFTALPGRIRDWIHIDFHCFPSLKFTTTGISYMLHLATRPLLFQPSGSFVIDYQNLIKFTSVGL